MRYITYLLFNVWQIFAIYSLLCHAEEKSESFIFERPKIILEDIMKQSHLTEPSMKNLVVPLFDNQDLKGVAENSLVILYQNTIKILNMFREKAKALTDQFIESLFLIDQIKEKISKHEFTVWFNQILKDAKTCTDKNGFFSIKDAIKSCPILKNAFINENQDTIFDLLNQDTQKLDTIVLNLFKQIERISEAYEIGMNAIAERTIDFVLELGIFDIKDGHILFDKTVELFPTLPFEDIHKVRRLAQKSSLLYTDATIQEMNQFEIDIDREKEKLIKDIRLLLGFHQFKYDTILVKKAIEKVGLENIGKSEIQNKLLTPQEYNIIELLSVKHIQIEQLINRYKQRVEEILKALNTKIDAITMKSFKQRVYTYVSIGLFKTNGEYLLSNNEITTQRRLMEDQSVTDQTHLYPFVKDMIDMKRHTEDKLNDEIPLYIQDLVKNHFQEDHILTSHATIHLRNFQTRIDTLYQTFVFEFLNKNNLSHLLNHTIVFDILQQLNSNVNTVIKGWEDLPIPLNIIQSIKSDNTLQYMSFDIFLHKLDELNRLLQYHMDEAIRYTISQLSRTGINLSSSEISALNEMMQTIIISQYTNTTNIHKQKKQYLKQSIRRLDEESFDDDTLLIELIKSIIEIMEEYEHAIEELEEKLVENADISVVIYEHFKKHDPEYLKEIQKNKYFDISYLTGDRQVAAEDAVEAIIQIYRGHLKALRGEILSIVEDNQWIIDTVGWERIEILQEKLEVMLEELTPNEAL